MKRGKPHIAKAIRGKLIVFEGADGSGKTTQAKLLFNFLKKNKTPAKYISFPRYESSLWGKMVRRYLGGDFGKVADVDPYFASTLYAGDRFSAADQIRSWLGEGKIIVCNRYVGSNIAHMGAKIKDKGLRIKYINWLEELEYGENKIPREDLVIFLRVPVEVSRNLIGGRKLDIHEKDLDYLVKVVNIFGEIAKSKSHWSKVDCTENGEILKPEEIHKKVLGVLRGKKLLVVK